MTRALLALAFIAAIAHPVRQDKEPPMLFTLECEGKQTTIETDTPQEVATGSGRMTVTLRALPHRAFAYGGVAFHYPRSFSFQHLAPAPGMNQWMVVGDRFLISVLHRKDVPDAVTWQKETEAASGRLYKGSKQSDVTLETGKGQLKGTRLDYTLAGMDMSQSSFVFQLGGDAVMIMLQDGPTTKLKRSDAAEEAETLFRNTFHLKGM